jgi:hypothetical protein
MDSESFMLLALVAPGSVEAEVGRIQAGIFQAHGFLSAMALPPLVPIAFIAPREPADARPRPRALLGDLERSAGAPWRIQARGPCWVDGWLYLGLDTGGMWAGLRAGALARCGGEQHALFPVAEGFFLGCGEAPARRREEISPAAPEMSFSSCDIALLRVQAAGGGGWWKDVDWETVDERPLRGRRKK